MRVVTKATEKSEKQSIKTNKVDEGGSSGRVAELFIFSVFFLFLSCPHSAVLQAHWKSILRRYVESAPGRHTDTHT